jgi:hypothetical protein
MTIKSDNLTWGEFFKKEFDRYNEKYKPRVRIKPDLLDLEIRNICAFTSAILEKGSLYLVSKKLWSQLYNIMKENNKHIVAEMSKLNTMYWVGLGNFMDRESLTKLFRSMSCKCEYIPFYVPDSKDNNLWGEPVLDSENSANKSVVVNKIRTKENV